MQAMVASLLVEEIRALDLGRPQVSDEDRAANADARRRLLAESGE
jgi:hypothetical protein